MANRSRSVGLLASSGSSTQGLFPSTQSTTPSLSQAAAAASTDWLAHRVGGVVTLRLPGDPPELPWPLFDARLSAYQAQVRGDYVKPPVV